MRLHRNFQLTDNKKLNAKTQLLRVVKIKFKVQENQRFSILIQTKNAKAIIGIVLPTTWYFNFGRQQQSNGIAQGGKSSS